MILLIVLIDTWWNVNIRAPLQFNNSRKVLIDTWWNVNMDSKQANSYLESF